MEHTARISVDMGSEVGRIKPMHGIGQPPITGLSNSLFHYLGRAGIPYSRLHDVGGWMGGGLYVDIPNLFRDFSADETDPSSYDFAFTDKIIEGLVKAGCQPYFRLGVTIENQHLVRSYRIFPPADFEKWARICEHVIRHYNEGWADGFHFGIVYWEIWNEPDDCYTNETAAMWKGTPEEYYRLYSVTARHLKGCFGDSIKVGGYGHCGVYEYAKDKELCGIDGEDEYIYDFTISFMHGFFKYQCETKAPIDFFSWHVYDNCHESTKNDIKVIREHAEYVRSILDKYGYKDAEHHLNEWNLNTDKYHRDSPIGAAKTLGFMLMMQNTSVDLMCFYDGGVGFSDYRALINPDTGHPYRSYYALSMFNSLYRLGEQRLAESDRDGVFVCAAAKRRRGGILIANTTADRVVTEIGISNFSVGESQILRIDEENRYTLTGETLSDGTIELPPYSCVEIKLWDI
ncbi:MAG: hypothetical protein IJY04_10400 [Clostridia bacterium]|nr:hypothetical protein [Clostridia bacterium]